MRTKLHFLSDGASARLSDIVAAACNPLKTLEWVKGTCRSKANSLKIKKIIFGQLRVLYLYFVALTVALGQPVGP